MFTLADGNIYVINVLYSKTIWWLCKEEKKLCIGLESAKY